MTGVGVLVSTKRIPSPRSRLATLCMDSEIPRRIRDLFANLRPSHPLNKFNVKFALDNWGQVEKALLGENGIGPIMAGQLRMVLVRWVPDSELAISEKQSQIGPEQEKSL